MAAAHLIARQVVEISAPDAAQARRLAERTGAVSGLLAAAVERALAACDTPGRRLRLDRITLDLAPCDPLRWEEDLVAGVERGLIQELRMSTAASSRVEPAAAAEGSAFELLAAFARTGRLPWWSQGDPRRAIADAVAQLREAAAPSDRADVRRLLAMPEAAERLGLQLKDDALAVLCGLVDPSAPPTLAAEVAWLATRAGVAQGPRRARAAIWRAVLRTVADAGGPVSPGPVAFWRAVVGELDDGTAAGLRGERPPRDAFVPAESALREALGAGSTTPSAPKAVPGAKEIIDDPRDAKTRQAGGEPRADARAHDDEGAHGAPEAPSRLTARLTTLGARDGPWAGLFARLAEASPALAPRAAAAVLAALGTAAAPPPGAISTALALAERGGALAREEAARWRDALAGDPTTSVTAPPAPMSPKPQDGHDVVAVENAGLALLWPFLPAFFAGCGLLEDKVFRDEAARHRAISLLDNLVTGEREAPEPRLTLGKVLCGLHPDAVHIPGEPLADVEVAEAERLLCAVLEHATVLGRISPDGFRASFLLRPGSLGVRDGAWLLRVERRTYDLLLERLPWSFSWVVLPWMAAAMGVEW